VIGLITGHLVLKKIYTKRFLVIAQECSDTVSTVPIVDELARET